MPRTKKMSLEQDDPAASRAPLGSILHQADAAVRIPEPQAPARIQQTKPPSKGLILGGLTWQDLDWVAGAMAGRAFLSRL